MLRKYGLKAVEYLFYSLALLAALPMLLSTPIEGVVPDHLAAVVLILVGLGVLVPRAVAYKGWHRVIAEVGTYKGTWDGERSATYTYRVGNQRYRGAFRSMYGTAKLTRVPVCVNPHAPWVRYPVFWNVWQFGAVMIAAGLFLLLADQHFFG